MNILVSCVGRLKEDYWKAAEAEYQKRLRRYARVTLREEKDEARLLLSLPSPRRLVLLDERGETLSSEALARDLLGSEAMHGGGRALCFAIGGAEGFSDAARNEADDLVAFGRITLPHRLCRVILLEQLYRAFTILRGEPYHK